MKHLYEGKVNKKIEKKEKCSICGDMYEFKSDDLSCPSCFNGCCDPSYHNGEACDGSC